MLKKLKKTRVEKRRSSKITFYRFGVDFGSILEAKMAPKPSPKRG